MTTPIIERTRNRCRPLLALCALFGCGSPPAEMPGPRTETWSVTAWGQRFEVFPEADTLVAGQVSTAYTHVTRLADFAPLAVGRGDLVLADASSEQVFGTDSTDRPGVFAIEISPRQTGEADILLRIHDQEGIEEIRGGRVRVGTAEDPGSLRRAPAPRGGTDGGEPLPFLKEQQWQSDFATDWVREGRLARSVAGLARLRPPAGGESTVTAPLHGVVQPPAGTGGWPFVGLRVDTGATLFRLVPLVAPERSLATLEADLANLTTELETVRARSARLEELLALEATSQREVEEACARATTLAARHQAASRNLAAARSAREGGSTGHGIALEAPFAGEIASVNATPGATVTAGKPLARLVRTDVIWVEVAVSSPDARELAASGIRGIVLDDAESEPMRIEEDVKLVSVAPELSPRTGTVSVLLEVPRVDGLALGATFAAQVLLTRDRQGIVVPASALVDDGGVPIVYLQLSGESFIRQQVTLLDRQGDLLLVDRLTPGQRLVTRGGDAIRRSSLMASGGAAGHVH